MFDTTFEVSKVFAISKFGETYLPSINRQTFEQIDSITLYNQKFLSRLTPQKPTLHIIVGLDSGLLANYVIEQVLDADQKYIFVELDEVLDLLTVDIPKSLQSQLFICNIAELPTLLKQESINLFIVKQQFIIHQSLAVLGGYIDDYAQLNQAVETTVEHEFFEQSIGFNQKIFINKQLENIAENNLPASRLKQRFRGKTCIILGGGPSLDNHLQWIKDNQNKLIVFAVSRLAGKLSQSGIHPDILVTVDPQDHAFDVYREMMPLSHKYLLIYSHHASPQIVGQWNGSLLYTSKRFPWTQDRDCNNFLSAGPTVTNSAIQIATEMGFKQILLCGVDFCHSQTGLTHAQGTFDAELAPDIGKMFEWIETYSGEIAETPIQLYHAAQALQDKVSQSPDTQFINLSKTAAKIKGVNYRKACDISLSNINHDLSNILSPAQHQMSLAERQTDLNDCLKQLKSAQAQYFKLIALIKEARQIAQQIVHAAVAEDGAKLAKLSNELDNIEEKINSRFPTESMLAKFYGYYEFSKFFTTQDSDYWTQSQVNEMTEIYYKAYQNICHEINQQVSAAITRTQSRLEELKPNGDLQLIYNQWSTDNQMGRVLIWKKMHPQQLSKLSPDQMALITKAESNYQQRLKGSENKANSQRIANLPQAYAKLSILHKNNHLIGISKMVQYLTPYKNSADLDIHRLFALASSYKLMLENKNDKALAEILTVDINNRNEVVLKQIIKLATKLNKFDLVLESLAAIAKYSDEYLPVWAQYLKLSGQPQQALNIYLDYLEKYPQDIPVMLKLGIFLAEARQFEGARSCFQNVLAIDEHNQTALNYLDQLNH